MPTTYESEYRQEQVMESSQGHMRDGQGIRQKSAISRCLVVSVWYMCPIRKGRNSIIMHGPASFVELRDMIRTGCIFGSSPGNDVAKASIARVEIRPEGAYDSFPGQFGSDCVVRGRCMYKEVKTYCGDKMASSELGDLKTPKFNGTRSEYQANSKLYGMCSSMSQNSQERARNQTNRTTVLTCQRTTQTVMVCQSPSTVTQTTTMRVTAKLSTILKVTGKMATIMRVTVKTTTAKTRRVIYLRKSGDPRVSGGPVKVCSWRKPRSDRGQSKLRYAECDGSSEIRGYCQVDGGYTQ
jgi:hypothetical protein